MSGARRKEERWEPSATETVELTGTVDFRHLHLLLNLERNKEDLTMNIELFCLNTQEGYCSG